MNNQNTMPERHDHPFHANEKSRSILKRSLMAVGGLAIAYAITNNATASPEEHLDKFYQPIHPLVNESVREDGPSDSASRLVSTVEEGDATSSVVEQATLRLAEEQDVDIKEGQSAVNLESSRYIEDATMQQTGGSVQPGDKIESWVDPSTGFIVSTRVISETK